MSETPSVPDAHWFNPLAAFVGRAYLRNAFTRGTEQEVEFLVDVLGLEAGMRVLDAGCGPGRHALALARRGIEVVGVDASPDFIALARGEAASLPVEFVEADVRELSYTDEFDAVICVCQGGFGLLGGDERELDVVDRFATALRPGGRLALSAFSAYFVVRHLEPGETFEADTGVNHEQAVVRDSDGAERGFDLWTTCYTPRELRLLAARAGLVVDGVFGVAPGRYARARPSVDVPEHLLVAHRSV
ncbi:MAG: Methyltransferase domain [Actinomycetia bacterium]|nr:Methyltransferase domain [Actinomycetes bacterium]